MGFKKMNMTDAAIDEQVLSWVKTVQADPAGSANSESLWKVYEAWWHKERSAHGWKFIASQILFGKALVRAGYARRYVNGRSVHCGLRTPPDDAL